MNGTPSTRSNTVVILALSTTILALLILIFMIRHWVPAPAIAGPTIEIEDEHAGVWMPFDNAFTKDPTLAWPDFKNKRAGFLFQSGTFFRYDMSGNLVHYNKSVTVEVSSTAAPTVVLTRGANWDWINIVGKYTGYNDAPITWDFAGILFPGTGKATLCDLADGCVSRVNLPTPPTVCTDSLATLAQPCVRLRSIHAYFEPGGIITYWQGEHGYSLAVKDRQLTTPHNRYTFTLNDPVTIEVWYKGVRNNAIEAQIASLGKNVKVKILEPPTSPHEDTYDPPAGPKPK